MFIRSASVVVAARAGLLVALLALASAPAAAAAGPPAPSFTTSPSPQAGQPVTFVASGSGAVDAYVWNFGDGSQSESGPVVQHTYSRGGIYTVTVTAVDSTGTSQTSQQVGVIGPPTAAFNPTEATVLAGSALRFDGTQSSDPDGNISTYSWNFGDGAGSGASQPTHSYTKPGTYNVSLTVTDNHGASSSVTHQITVIAPPPIQTLVESIIPAPILVKFGAPSMLGRAIVDLHERLFCPGSGPVCQTTITEPKPGVPAHRRALARAAANTVLTTRPNGNAELALHLSSAQVKTLAQKHHLSLGLVIVSKRGAEKVTTTLAVRLARKG